MGTYNSNILPTTTGLSLGSAIQQWNANLAAVSTLSLNNKVYVQSGESAAAAVGRLLSLNPNGGVVYFDQGVYPSGGLTISTPNVMLVGAGMPSFNSVNSPTFLTGGTVIQGPISVVTGADRFSIRDIGIDAGSNYVAATGGVPLDALSISNPGQVIGASQVQSPVIMNVCALGSSTTAPNHAMLVENVNNAYVSNVVTCLNQHGLVLKGTYCTVNGVWARGHGNDAIIVKSDNYAPSSFISISNFHITYLASAGDTRGIILQALGAGLSYVNITNGDITGFLNFGILIQGATNTIIANQINISNVTMDGFTGNVSANSGIQFQSFVSIIGISNCSFTNMQQGIQPIAVSNFSDLRVDNCTFLNISSIAIETSVRSVVCNSTFVNVTGVAIQTDSGTTNVDNNFFSIVGSNYGGVGTTLFGGVGTIDNKTNILFNGYVGSSTGIFISSAAVTITALATPVALPNTIGLNGLLRVRDQTLGGVACFILDPNNTVQLIGTSFVTGMGAAQVTYSSGWFLQLSGGSVPRIISWTIYN